MHSLICQQEDVECDYGYEYINHECRPIKDLSNSHCSALSAGRYHVSETKHRLINADVCMDVSRVIRDTDGKGNVPGGPGSGSRSGHGKIAKAIIALLVRGQQPICYG